VSSFGDDLPDEDDEGDQGPIEPQRRQRKRRDGARPKVRAQRELKREVFRHSLEHNTNIKDSLVVALKGRRPQTRGDCRGGQRPCPWASCKYHLFLSVNPDSGAITFNFPDKEIWDLEETCALDVAERGGVTLEEVGRLTNVTRERVRQVETKALVGVKGTRVMREVDED
jgi:hypothetical protein